ncbi:MAG: hypothetical protein RL026_948 [Pseudomonadota bacterium]|jgi:methyl-accepting chemotaxis protein-1 (serine sensor receptor)
MTPQSDAFDRVRLRRSLLRLSSSLLLIFLATGLLALFVAWSLDRMHLRQLQSLGELVRAVDDGRGAQATFKLQVQEWKNALLRGADPALRRAHLEAFEKQERLVSARLRSLQQRLPALGLDDVAGPLDGLLARHQELGARYRAALPPTEARWNAQVIDTAVRGIDRPLDAGIDALATALVDTAAGRVQAARLEAANHYQQLRAALWIAFATALLMVGLLLWRLVAAEAD